MPKKPIKPDQQPEDSWAEDQKERGYYYDDSHGYEKYDVEDCEDVNDQVEGVNEISEDGAVHRSGRADCPPL